MDNLSIIGETFLVNYGNNQNKRNLFSLIRVKKSIYDSAEGRDRPSSKKKFGSKSERGYRPEIITI